MNSLNEIFGTSESDDFSNLSAGEIGKSTEDLIPSHEEINFGTVFDLDMRWPCDEIINVGQGTGQDFALLDEALLNPHDALFSYSFQQTNQWDLGVNINSFPGISDEEDYNPYLYMLRWQSLPEIVSPYCSQSLSRGAERLPITLVLDLDGMSHLMLFSHKYSTLFTYLTFCPSIACANCCSRHSTYSIPSSYYVNLS